MSLWQNILLSIVGLIAIVIIIEILLKRGRPRPSLAKQFLGDDVDDAEFDKPELGMEEIDMDVIRASERGNKSAAALGARDMDFWTKRTIKRAQTPQQDIPKETNK
ncbi:MAG TPA: hypothetical protein DD729_02240 [Rhodobacteraceae bacterium]|jgi:hypothetical protein|nr:hypothetical protein [Paracoccaceae bacterium]